MQHTSWQQAQNITANTVMLSSCIYLGLRWTSHFSEGVEMLRHHLVNNKFARLGA